jgi:hypothetical protein
MSKRSGKKNVTNGTFTRSTGVQEFRSTGVQEHPPGQGGRARERDPRKLASLADYRVKKSRAQIEAALTGDYRPELLFVLRQD